MDELEELEIELRAVQEAMDRAYFRVQWEKLRAIEAKLNTKIKQLKKGTNEN